MNKKIENLELTNNNIIWFKQHKTYKNEQHRF
jgi:hypothetical protein